MRWRQHASILGFVFGAVVISVIGVLGYRTVVLQTETVLWIEHTHRVIERIDDISIAVSTAESAVRDFALSRETYLAHDLEPQIEQAQRAYEDVQGTSQRESCAKSAHPRARSKTATAHCIVARVPGARVARPKCCPSRCS